LTKSSAIQRPPHNLENPDQPDIQHYDQPKRAVQGDFLAAQTSSLAKNYRKSYNYNQLPQW
jgi:hypothetical protein